MAPFPEAEIMTIKRLEVALRKMDFKLLKDGAYKLHEKFHSGHKFEYIDLLKELLSELSNNPSVPLDIKDILCPTIEDILAEACVGEQVKEEVAPSLDPLNYNTVDVQNNSFEDTFIDIDEPVYSEPVFKKTEETAKEVKFEFQEEVKINAFDAFGSQKVQNEQTQKRFFTQSPFSAEPFKEFSYTPQQSVSSLQQLNNQEDIKEEKDEKFEIFELNKEPKEEANEIIEKEIEENASQMPIQEQEQVSMAQTSIEKISEAPKIENETMNVKEEKVVSIFYAQDNSDEKIKNILKFKKIISSTTEKSFSIDDLMALISEITMQSNTNTIELQGVLKQLKAKKNKVSLITNSQSEMLIELLDSIELTYALYENNKDCKINFLPLFGLSNLFSCSECNQKYLDKSSEVKPLVYECPQCKNAMYPDFWAAGNTNEINLQYYNEAMVNLANSDVWLIIHPSYNDKISSDLIESALRVSNAVKEVYVLDKDINIRENYKNFISKIRPNIKVNVNNNVLEEFFNTI